jgi:hypothetical protein
MVWTNRYAAICIFLGIVASLTNSVAWGQDQPESGFLTRWTVSIREHHGFCPDT